MIINEDGLITENQNLPQPENIEETQRKNTQNEIFDLESNGINDEINLNNVSENSNATTSSLLLDPVLIDEDSDLSQDSQLDKDSQIKQSSQKLNDVETNCLALTVRKDYNLSIIKNGFFTTLRMSWKVAVSTFVLNFIKLFL